MIVLRICGGPIIYLSILSMILGTSYGGYLMYNHSMALPEVTDPPSNDKVLYLYGSYAVFGFAAILVCCVCFNLKNIRIGVAVMQCTAAFIGGTPQVFLVPPVFIALLVAWFAVWVVVVLYVISIGELKQRDDFVFLTSIIRTDDTTYMFLYTLFGYLWVNALMIGIA